MCQRVSVFFLTCLTTLPSTTSVEARSWSTLGVMSGGALALNSVHWPKVSAHPHPLMLHTMDKKLSKDEWSRVSGKCTQVEFVPLSPLR